MLKLQKLVPALTDSRLIPYQRLDRIDCCKAPYREGRYLDAFARLLQHTSPCWAVVQEGDTLFVAYNSSPGRTTQQFLGIVNYFLTIPDALMFIASLVKTEPGTRNIFATLLAGIKRGSNGIQLIEPFLKEDAIQCFFGWYS
jgi:hypothetical protein